MNIKYFELGYELNQSNKLVLWEYYKQNIPDELEKNIKCLILEGNFDSDINENGKKKLKYIDYFSYDIWSRNKYIKIDLSNLPDNIRILKLTKFNEPINYLPSNLKVLKVSNFNQPVNNLIVNLEVLCLGNLFSYPVDNLPNTIKTLFLGNSFNQSVDYLPNSLKKLILGFNFNQSLDNLPYGLEYLVIGVERYCLMSEFLQTINNLPNSLKYLSIGVCYSQQINKLPNDLLILKLNYFTGKINTFSDSLEYIKLPGNYSSGLPIFPKTLKKISCGQQKKLIKKIFYERKLLNG